MKLSNLFNDCVRVAQGLRKGSARPAREWLKSTTILALLLIISIGNAWGANVTLTLSDNSTDTWTNQGVSGGGTAIAMYDKSVTGITLSGTSGYCNTGSSYTQIYASSTTTIASTVGKITKIVFNGKYKSTSGSFTDENSSSQAFGSSFGNKTFTYASGVSSMGFTASKQIYLKTATVYYATATTSKTSITGLDYTAGSGPSTAQSFTVSGTDLGGTLTVSAPTNFEVSKTSSTSGFASSVTLTPSSGTVSSTTIYVRLASGKSAGTYGGASTYVTVTGGGIITKNISVQGTVSSSCANTVTITKGASTNCSFSLDKSGAQASCDGVVTTISITPNTGYGTPVVSESGASSTPTKGGSGNSQTLTYAANTTGTSTIAVSCSANNYTINLDKDLTPTSAGTPSITATYNASTNLTSAITPPTKTGWTFAGYFTAKNGGGTQIIDASGNVIASVSGYTDASKNWKYAGNITLYAKWTCTVTWSVNNLTNVYSAQTLTYNGTSTKVASIPGPPSPASYCGDKFVGWTSVEDYVHGTSNLFTTVAGSPNLNSIGSTTFYAVFADYGE